MADKVPIDPQTLRSLLSEVLRLQEEYAAMRIVLQAVAETHIDRPALIQRLDYLAKTREQVDQGQALSDEDIAARKERVEKWIRWIEQY